MDPDADLTRRTLVVLDGEECGIDAFARVLERERPEDIGIRVIVRAVSSRQTDIAAATQLLHDATLAAQRRGFTGTGGAVVRTPRDLEAELAEAIGFDDAVIIMPESPWPTSQSSRLRRSAQRYGALVRFDCVAE